MSIKPNNQIDLRKIFSIYLGFLLHGNEIKLQDDLKITVKFCNIFLI